MYLNISLMLTGQAMSKVNVIVSVKPKYLKRESLPAKKRYVFSYTVTIKNESDLSIKLLSRHWIITNGETLKTQEVQGDGVIGQQPKIKPAKSYSYTSGTVMDSPVGTMHGCYHMVNEKGERFEVQIPPFTLAVTHNVH